jgi:hypothetical protein
VDEGLIDPYIGSLTLRGRESGPQGHGDEETMTSDSRPDWAVFFQDPTPTVDVGGVNEQSSCDTINLVVPPTSGFSPKIGVQVLTQSRDAP